MHNASDQPIYDTKLAPRREPDRHRGPHPEPDSDAPDRDHLQKPAPFPATDSDTEMCDDTLSEVDEVEVVLRDLV